jgi:hypothetical protein
MPDIGPSPRGPVGRLAAQFSLPEPLAHLRQAARWVGWKWTQKPDGGWDKPPFRADYPDFHASTTNPKSWVLLDVAERSLEAGLIDGIGYVIREDAENVYLDLDDCRDPITGEVAEWALALIEECDSYTELTPSGCGFRIIGTHGGFLSAPIDASYRLPCGGHGEVYFRGLRYVTMTGLHLAGTPTELREIGGAALELLARAGRKLTPPTQAKATTPEQARAPLRDVLAALATVRNDDLEYDDWLRVGLATFAATSGEGEGLEAWMRWSAKSAKHHDHECLRAWNSFHKSPPRSIGFGSLAYLARAANPLWTAPSWRGEAVAEAAHDPETGELIEDRPAPASPPKPGRAIRLLTMAEVEAMPPPQWLIYGVIPRGGLVIPYGPPKAGKTFLVTAWGLHVAAGLEWCGRPTTQGAVVYVVGEGLGGFSARLAVMREAYGIPSTAPFFVIPRAVNFRDDNAVKELVAAIEAALPSGVTLALIVIDTLARAMPGVDENSAQEVGLVIARCDAVKEHFGATVMPVHHTGKDTERGMRGSNALLGAVDASYLIQRAGKGVVRLKNDAMKDAEEFADMLFDMEQVHVGLRSSLVPRMRDTTRGRPEDPEKPSTDELRMRVIIAMAGQPSLPLRRVAEALNMAGGRGQLDLQAAIPLGRECAASVHRGAVTTLLWRRISGEHKTAAQFIHMEDDANEG